MTDIKIISAALEHKDEVLSLLDDFREYCGRIMFSDPAFTSTTARDLGSDTYDGVLSSKNGEILLAVIDNKVVGVATVYAIPRIRTGDCVAEIEDFFVIPEYHGKGVAVKLMDGIMGWAKEKGAIMVRLETDPSLEQAHKFYEKFGFKHYAKAYSKNI